MYSFVVFKLVNNMDAKTIKKRIRSAFTACGWLLGIQAFGAAYHLITGITDRNNTDILTGLIACGIGAIFYWLYRKTKEETTYKNLGAMFLLCLGIDVSDIAFMMIDEKIGVLLFSLAVRVPICVLLYKGTIAGIEHYKKTKSI
jgi:hypothetical protein